MRFISFLICICFLVSCYTINIETNPTGAEVYLIEAGGTTLLGNTPVTIDDSSLSHIQANTAITLELKKANFKTEKLVIPDRSFPLYTTTVDLQPRRDAENQALQMSFDLDGGIEAFIVTDPQGSPTSGEKISDSAPLDFKKLRGKYIVVSKGNNRLYHFLVDSKNIDELKLSFPNQKSNLSTTKMTKEQAIAYNAAYRQVLLSLVQFTKGKLDESIATADQVISSNQKIASPHVIKALVYLKKGNLGEAKTAIAQASQLDTENPMIKALSFTLNN